MKSSTTFTKEQQLYKARKKEQRKRKFERELEKAANQEKVAKTSEPSEKSKEPNFDALKDVQTFSIAIPGSILDNAQSKELRTYLAGQIARTACIYKIDEVIIFYDGCEKQSLNREDGISRCCVQFGRILQYLECPQYLRKYIFPIHKDLEYAGLLNPLDAPHHLREEDQSPYREGITTAKAAEDGCYVEVGLKRPCLIKQKIIPNVRVTLKLLPKTHDDEKRLKGIVVPPSLPRHEGGLYWGYNVRIVVRNAITFCRSSRDFTTAHFRRLTVPRHCSGGGHFRHTGRKTPRQSLRTQIQARANVVWRIARLGSCIRKRRFSGKPLDSLSVPRYKHGLMLFGGLQGLEAALENDETLDAENVEEVVDVYVNTCPNQGSRTIRTEEAVLISLAAMSQHLPK
ncbi:putative methyltransferase C9orf114 [Diaphorina citri]|uniref:Methyltransferase C9orf114 n=1 Tax=Diaphorina citri TaxID=121845 RepID=A0A1S4EJT3_DIACI|nr:putative methyltransferase C9orf114 [Diaphorina citri]